MAKKGLTIEQHVSNQKMIVGWREWVTLPQLQIPAIKAKVDTGARTSALHAFFVEPVWENGVHQVRFLIHPLQRRTDIVRACVATVVDQRLVTDSGGHREERYVIETLVQIGALERNIEITLTNREEMGFRMLLGRTALRQRMVVDPALSYQTGRTLGRAYRAPGSQC